jgi:hypothetical protein
MIMGGITMKKLLLASVWVLALLMSLPITAFAHGHGSVAATANRTIVLCAVPDCNIVGNHYHDGVLSAGHSIGDGHGHGYHQSQRSGGHH